MDLTSNWIAFVEAAATGFGAVIAVLLPFELWHLWRQGRLDRQRLLEMLASASPLLPTLLTGGVVTAFIIGLYTFAATLAPWHLPVTWWSMLLSILAVDFMYYWDHRAGHRNGVYWAIAHSVHHSSPSFDQSTGLRVSFIDGFISPWFYVPVVLAGFHPLLVGAALAFIIGWQQWLHTETIGRLPALDPWLNTPANHRVHHGVQPQYNDRNFGAVLMVWDRLFGTYAAEEEPVRYGITHPVGSVNPVVVHLAEARRLLVAVLAARGWRARLTLLWSVPRMGVQVQRVCLTGPNGGQEKGFQPWSARAGGRPEPSVDQRLHQRVR